MAYWDGYTANLFREDGEGRRVMTPWGNRGPVYIVRTEADAAAITRTFRRMYQLMLFAVLVPLLAFGWHWMVLGAIVWLVAFYAMLFLVSRRLPRHELSADRLPPVSRAVMRDRASFAIGRRALLAMLLGSLSFVAIGIWLIVARGPSMIAYGSIALFGLYSALFIYQLRRATRSSSEPPAA